MGIRELFGEVPVKYCIRIGAMVKVIYGTHECVGRLNKATNTQIEVGRKTIDIRDIIKIESHTP